MNGALSADLARVLNLQGQPASPTHMQVSYYNIQDFHVATNHYNWELIAMSCF